MRLKQRLKIYTRSNGDAVGDFEKPVILPDQNDKDFARHAWADARFATDIMAEHGLFFALLMPEDIAPKERQEALRFSEIFSNMHEKIDAMDSLESDDVPSFVREITDEMKQFIEYKQEQQEAQESGNLRSLVWPLFFEHTRHEAERWVRRLEQLSKKNYELDRREVVTFWANIMDEHARFVAHLLDPNEFELIDTALRTSNVFRGLEKGGMRGVASAAAREPRIVATALAKNPEVDAVMAAAETILDFKTEAARDIEKARIKSIIDPRLADHVRREALKFVDELRRAE